MTVGCGLGLVASPSRPGEGALLTSHGEPIAGLTKSRKACPRAGEAGPGGRRSASPRSGRPEGGVGGLTWSVLHAAAFERFKDGSARGRRVRPGGDGGVDLLRDQPVDPLLGRAGQAVEGAWRAEEIFASGLEVGGERHLDVN